MNITKDKMQCIISDIAGDMAVTRKKEYSPPLSSQVNGKILMAETSPEGILLRGLVAIPHEARNKAQARIEEKWYSCRCQYGLRIAAGVLLIQIVLQIKEGDDVNVLTDYLLERLDVISDGLG